jgi:type IV secretion system protein VirD4
MKVGDFGHLLRRSGAADGCSPSAAERVRMLACLNELPSTVPLLTMRTWMANERAPGVSFIYAVQTWRHLAAVLG